MFKLGKSTSGITRPALRFPAPGTLGNAGQGVVMGPHFVDTDFAVLKDTTIHENLQSAVPR